MRRIRFLRLKYLKLYSPHFDYSMFVYLLISINQTIIMYIPEDLDQRVVLHPQVIYMSSSPHPYATVCGTVVVTDDVRADRPRHPDKHWCRSLTKVTRRRLVTWQARGYGRSRAPGFRRIPLRGNRTRISLYP